MHRPTPLRPRRSGRGFSRRAAAGLLLSAAVAGCGGGGSRPGPAAPLAANPFAPLHAAAPPSGWILVTAAGRTATLAYPPGWARVAADAGSISAARRDRRTGVYHGYLNVTPRQGAEALRGWADFRVGRNRAEGSGGVREVAAAEHLPFRGATGSCMIDDYGSRVGGHRYRELACIVAGRRATVVFIGATPTLEWSTIGPLLERSASALLVH